MDGVISAEKKSEDEGSSADQVDVGKAFQDSRIEQVMEDLDRKLVGLDSVKMRIREIAAFLLVDRLRREVGLGAERAVLHMCFIGRSGTGKIRQP